MTSRGPRPPRRRSGPNSFVAVAATAVTGGVGIIVLFLQLARSPKVANQLGSSVFVAGRAVDLARLIEGPGGGPLLFQDLLGRSRDIYLQHRDPDPLKGWSAFDAHPPGEARTCVLTWTTGTATFHDPCRGATYSADGTGLTRYRTTVDSAKRVVVDLRTTLP